MTHNTNQNFSFQRSQSVDLTQPQSRTFFHATSNSNLSSMSAPASFQRRTVESARQLRDSITTVIRDLEPLVETARSVNAEVTNFLSRPQSEQTVPRPANESHNDSFYINLEVEPTRDPEIPIQPENEINPGNNADNNNTENDERNQTVAEAQQFLKVLSKYVPFVLILIAKSLYDYHDGIFILAVLFITFAHTNSVVKRETIKRQRRSKGSLALELLYIIVCLLFIHYVFADDLHDFNVILNLVLIRSFTHTLTVWNLLWIVTITDFTLKLLTVSVKILLTMLPGAVLDFKKRGKIYLFIEAISQMYRSIVTIQPWLYYLLESYQGPEKIVAVFLSAFYMISKGSDLMLRVKLLKVACLKLLQNVSIGSSPSKDQIQTAGDHCPICHDQYDSPVLLQCRHIFCESCVTTWFDREQTCPLCRAKIVDDPSWRDGSTAYFMQLF
ncbi:RING finger and transmembrane domain-containing protein 2 [Diorhabda sublineata]|uniref:RING finger and transmembrane domain-containing protein 2 n=1 Tax=Diorhabda sublineata TaxID=1163346 RepID=UPI0024E0C29A|nr:RING finger and transmembrane domain-containing protein 2 [Diorhabda sublineata]